WEGGVRRARDACRAHPLCAAARERPDLAAALSAMVAGYPGQHWLGQDPHRETWRPLDVMEGIAVPALVAVGERDVAGFREMSAVLARRIPGAAYHVVANAGHMVTMEQPAAINDLLTGFLQEAPWTRWRWRTSR